MVENFIGKKALDTRNQTPLFSVEVSYVPALSIGFHGPRQ
ncbi:12110_t:CDS:2 [Dentiscutata heterogama]|uniref:12110_t:CDS:1 n=1 Tax=Dentiscutata heterogama TaxID=1316150 RepID=A0ACA9KD87_9GLOM|nr:12110_t:CDS:2 [Dentiscutata heterogama]